MFELKIKIKRHASSAEDIIRCLLLNMGVAPDAIVEQRTRGEDVISVYDSSSKRIRQLNAAMRSYQLRGVQVSSVSIKDEDWQQRWKKYFKPFKITSDILLVPAHLKKTASKGVQTIYIDTTFAFGSGMHATTQMMARLLQCRKGHYATMLDIGTGSGVLAIIATRYGAERVFAIDNDKVAIKTAQHNFELNDVRPDVLKTMPFERYAGKKQFDFVAANLITEDLIRMRKDLSAVVKPRGYLAVSGIFKDNYPLFRKRFQVQGLNIIKELRKNKWHAALFQKI